MKSSPSTLEFLLNLNITDKKCQSNVLLEYIRGYAIPQLILSVQYIENSRSFRQKKLRIKNAPKYLNKKLDIAEDKTSPFVVILKSLVISDIINDNLIPNENSIEIVENFF